jgi:hypothetical protein
VRFAQKILAVLVDRNDGGPGRLVRPVVGGLFLAFPAIFPASATLIEKHVRERKEKAGLPDEVDQAAL